MRLPFHPLPLVPLLGLLAAAAPALAQPEAILIEYRDKPPYSYTEGQRPTGLLIDKTVAIFKLAKLPYKLEEVPLKRIVKDIQTATRPTCSPGWYKLPEREQFARFSVPLHQDLPHVVLAAPDAITAVRAHRELKTLVKDPGLQLAVVDGVSYGPELDQMIASVPKPAVRATVTALHLSKMLHAGRADYMFIDQEDLGYLDRQGEVTNRGVQRIDFPDAPQGMLRYMMCSKNLDDATLKRIDEAIRKLGFDTAR